MKHLKRILAIVLMATLLMTTLMVTATPAFAASKKSSKTVKTTKVALSQTGTVTLNVGETLKLTATLKPAKSTQTVKWSTSKKSVATVKNGKVTAKKAGTATITAKSGKKSAKVKVKVVKGSEPVKVTKVTLDRSGTVKLPLNEKLTLAATLSPSTASSKLTWSTSNKKVATVKNGVVTPKKKGTVTITVKTANGKKTSVKVKVVAKSSKPATEPTKAPTPTAQPTTKPTTKPTTAPTASADHTHVWMNDEGIYHAAEGHYEETSEQVSKGTVQQTIDHPAEFHWDEVTKTVVTKEAWDETITVVDEPEWEEIVDRMICNKCGAVWTSKDGQTSDFFTRDRQHINCPANLAFYKTYPDTPQNREDLVGDNRAGYIGHHAEIVEEWVGEDGIAYIKVKFTTPYGICTIYHDKVVHPAVTHTETVHHDAETEQVTEKVKVVDSEAWTETKDVELYDTIYRQVWVEDKPEWYEKVGEGKVCTVCGQRK